MSTPSTPSGPGAMENGPVESHGYEAWDRALDERFYDPDPEVLAFYKSETGIEDGEELRRHVLAVQREAFAIKQYPCIRIFEFMQLKLARLDAYEQLVKLGRERTNAIFLDVGCCFGNDIRKLVRDGWPVQTVMAIDLHKVFWDLGHKLFRSTPQTFPATFIQGDIFDPSFLSIATPTQPSPAPDLQTLTTLTPLRHRVSAIFTGAFFHLFPSAAQQRYIARALAGLLSPERGSMILGVHGGLPGEEARFWEPEGTAYRMFCHCERSWREMWEGVFAEVDGDGGSGGVQVRARLREEKGGPTVYGTYPHNTRERGLLEWSVVRT